MLVGESSCFVISSQVVVEVLLSLFEPCTSYYQRERERKIDAALESAKGQLIAVIDKKTRGMGAVRRFVPVGALSENIIARCRSNPKFAKLTPEEQVYFAEELFEHGCKYCYGLAPGWKEVERHVRRFADAMEIAEPPPPEENDDSTAKSDGISCDAHQTSLLRLAKTMGRCNCAHSKDPSG
mmetsp:Transcript_23836/g.70396  ORF Transcript_23836/g.70396 Transcript_23836/m.70396 type:complete len:182 (-) Transcript_23836:222-767(-)